MFEWRIKIRQAILVGPGCQSSSWDRYLYVHAKTEKKARELVQKKIRTDAILSVENLGVSY
jgi:hypothetical protein